MIRMVRDGDEVRLCVTDDGERIRSDRRAARASWASSACASGSTSLAASCASRAVRAAGRLIEATVPADAETAASAE